MVLPNQSRKRDALAPPGLPLPQIQRRARLHAVVDVVRDERGEVPAAVGLGAGDLEGGARGGGPGLGVQGAAIQGEGRDGGGCCGGVVY